MSNVTPQFAPAKKLLDQVSDAISAILFLYRHVLLQSIDIPADLIRAEKPKTLPTVLTHAEAMTVIQQMKGTTQLMAKLLCGGGLAAACAPGAKWSGVKSPLDP